MTSGTANISVDMGDDMYFYFLIEDRSTEELIKAVMTKLSDTHSDLFYDCKSFHGIGGYAKKLTPKAAKTGKLLNDLPIYLRGFDRKLQAMPDSALVIVLDNDDNDPITFRAELNTLADTLMISTDHVFCLAVEEMEAWLLGDWNAVKVAYPAAKASIYHSYEQDSICGTWEVLANTVYPGGLAKLRKDCPSYIDIGAKKIEWAQKIGVHMDLRCNRSPSFQNFLSEIEKRLPATA